MSDNNQLQLSFEKESNHNIENIRLPRKNTSRKIRRILDKDHFLRKLKIGEFCDDHGYPIGMGNV